MQKSPLKDGKQSDKNELMLDIENNHIIEVYCMLQLLKI
mgnify:CR=1 FL=1